MQTPYIRRFGQGAFPRPTTVLTSRPYPLIIEPERVDSGWVNIEGRYRNFYSLDQGDSAYSAFVGISGSVREVLKDYDAGVELASSSFVSIEGNVRQILRGYDSGAEEATSSFVSIEGTLNQILITYGNYEPEEVDSSFVSISGDLN